MLRARVNLRETNAVSKLDNTPFNQPASCDRGVVLCADTVTGDGGVGKVAWAMTMSSSWMGHEVVGTESVVNCRRDH
jgi:hypothetical protein